MGERVGVAALVSDHHSPLLDLPGAVAATRPDVGVAAHYGEPMREQRLLADGGAVVDLSHRGVVRITGPDRLPWLHSLLSQAVVDLQPGQRTEALVLSPNGHVENHLRLVDDGESTWATVEPGAAAPLVRFLESMRFFLRVEVVDESARWAALGRDGEEELVPRDELVAAAMAAPARAGIWAYEALRIARGEARLGVDTDHRTIPNEVGWLGRAVHLDKGCYRGQETVARVHNLGRPPRRLTRLELDGSVERLPSPGDTLLRRDTEQKVGTVGSSARHHVDGPIALALVKRTVAPAADLLVRTAEGDVAASQTVIVDPEVGLHVRPRP